MTDERPADAGTTQRMMRMLEDGVPLSLLLDLFWPDGPTSREILDGEGLPDQQWWRPPRETV